MDLLEELKQDVRRQKFEDIVINNGGKIITLAVLIVALTAGLYFANQYKAKKNLETGLKFYQAIESSKNTEEKIAALDEFAKSSPANYGSIAELRKADELILSSKFDEAKAALESVSKNAKFDQAFREIAELKLVNILVGQNGAEDEIVKRLDALSQPNSVFKFSAIEAKANYLLSKGKKAEAIELYSKLADDKNAPEGISNRAKRFAPKA